MKRKFEILLFIAILMLFVLSLAACGTEGERPLRLHIRANSNAEIDQNVKLTVRDEVVKFLTPLLKDADSEAEAKKIIGTNSEKLRILCEKTLNNRGFFYGAEVKICEEYFPTRSYGEVTLEAGVYDAVIINLGSGEGNNWWCVAYPPLCFGGETDDIEYCSKIWDLINSRSGRN